MRFITTLFLLTCLLALTVSRTVTAQQSDAATATTVTDALDVNDDDDDFDEDYDIDELISSTESFDFFNLPTSPDITTTAYFVDHTTPITLPTGKELTILFGVQNNGQIPYNLTYIQASLLSAYDRTFHIQNFTLQPLSNAIIAPQQELTLDYKIYADPSLETANYVINGFVLFNNSMNRIYKNTLINQRVKLVDTHSTYFDFQTISALLMTAALVVGSGYGLLFAFAPKLLSGGKSGKYKHTVPPTQGSRKKKQ